MELVQVSNDIYYGNFFYKQVKKSLLQRIRLNMVLEWIVEHFQLSSCRWDGILLVIDLFCFYYYLTITDVVGGSPTTKRSDVVLDAFPEMEEPDYETSAVAWEIYEEIQTTLPAGIALCKYQKAYAMHFTQYLLVPFE